MEEKLTSVNKEIPPHGVGFSVFLLAQGEELIFNCRDEDLVVKSDDVSSFSHSQLASEILQQSAHIRTSAPIQLFQQLCRAEAVAKLPDISRRS